ncbi:hypothetical protein, partial [Salmonella sp. s51228]|uniref:hypothetical protein n=1 Tax=Salmonella sp. s51228 TaxID=3159652 RepID=UPI0039801173
KKGQILEVAKKRSRKTVKYQRAIQGSTLEKILQLRNQSSAVRKLQREQALKVAKEKAKAKKTLKAPLKKTEKKTGKSKVKAVKNPKTAKPKVGGKR